MRVETADRRSHFVPSTVPHQESTLSGWMRIEKSCKKLIGEERGKPPGREQFEDIDYTNKMGTSSTLLYPFRITDMFISEQRQF